jgi:hypothetical protein
MNTWRLSRNVGDPEATVLEAADRLSEDLALRAVLKCPLERSPRAQR